MKTGKIIFAAGILWCSSFIVAEEYTPEQKREIGQKALHEMMQKIYSKGMEAKRNFRAQQYREEMFGNFATTAPRTEFIINADISEELQSGIESATVYVSTDGQSSWQSAPATLIGSEGYETTWSGTIGTFDGNSAFSYLSGLINSEVLDAALGTIIVSGTPHNVNGNWPPSSSLYAHMVEESSGDAPSNQDITAVRGTYKGSAAVNSEGNAYMDVERFYLSLTINGGCCDPGGYFGPWYLYGAVIINPEAEANVVYAIGYADGGFGELTQGLLKLTGDLGNIEGFEYVTTNISCSTSGNNMQATTLMSYLTNDPDWGTWPNSFNGFIVLGITLEAGFDGSASLLDDTNSGLMICATTSQEGNIALSLSNPSFDAETNILSVTYLDGDGNLPWKKSVQLCDAGTTDNCTSPMDMIPDSHSYGNGVIFSTSTNAVADGDYDANFWFADDDIENYPAAQINLPITIGSGGSGCETDGDLNGDSQTNVLDVVLLVNLVLINADADACSDVNGDGILNVLDIVLLVNIVLGG
jgi:hypothetical protein